MGNTASVKKKIDNAPVVVIIGGGYAGTAVAQKLDATMNVVVIERKDYFLHVVGTPRAVVHPDFAPTCAIPYNKLLKNGCVIQATVESIAAGGESITFVGGHVLNSYDYLVIATGSSYPFPFRVDEAKRSDVQAPYDTVASDIKGARNVVIVGGGSTGIETAGEIAEIDSECKVTLVHAGPQLMMPGPWPAKFINKLTAQLKKLPNITLILNDRVLVPDGQDGRKQYLTMTGGKVKTQEGKEFECDLLFWCIGGRINSSTYNASLPIDPASKGLKVNAYLQVEDTTSSSKMVFACGDCAHAGTMKTVNYAHQHAKRVAINIKRHAKGQALKKFDPEPDLNITEIGHKYGAGYLPIGVVGPRVVQFVKKDMFASMFWKHFGYSKIPPKSAAPQIAPKDTLATKLQKVLKLDAKFAEQLANGLDPADLD